MDFDLSATLEVNTSPWEVLTGKRTFTYTTCMSKQSQYDKIVAFYHKSRRMPSYGEIMRLGGFKSKNAAYKLVSGMVEQGLLDRDGQGKLIPRQSILSVKLLGTVEAGFPSPAEEELVDTMTLDEYLIHNREATYLLKVKGDSMIEAGIMPGDMVLVERGNDAREGDIVIAEVDHEWTMKYFTKKGARVVLMPANKKYHPITPQDELRIAATVKAVIRKYS